MNRIPLNGPIDGDRIPYFAEVPTFLRLPVNRRGAGADICILGIPFDAGVTERSGAREGPRAIRVASSVSRPVHGRLGAPYAHNVVVDAGDVEINPLDPKSSRTKIEHRYKSLRNNGARIIAIGGDHSVSLHCLASLNWGEPVALIHFDAHTDTSDVDSGSKINHATVIRRAVEKGFIDPLKSVQIGIRPDLHSSRDLKWAREAGIAIIQMDELMARDLAASARSITRQVKGAPTYLSLDIDVLDPAFAPGTGTPEPGGLSTRELRFLLTSLVGVRLVGSDLVEVAPCYDTSNITALVAGRILFDLVCLMAHSSP